MAREAPHDAAEADRLALFKRSEAALKSIDAPSERKLSERAELAALQAEPLKHREILLGNSVPHGCAVGYEAPVIATAPR